MFEVENSIPTPVSTDNPIPEEIKVDEPVNDEGTSGEEVVSTEPQPEPDLEPTPEVTPTLQEMELPDGRKVSVEEGMKIWKEHFMPEFTRKSQRLAEYEKSSHETVEKGEIIPKWKEDDYTPSKYSEIIEIAKQEALKEIEAKQRMEEENKNNLEKMVNDTVAELRILDPKLDEKKLFDHAVKYGFNDLRAAHRNMLDMSNIAINIEQKTLTNVKARDAIKVSATPTKVETPTDEIISPGNSFGGALDYYNNLKK